MRYVLSCCLFLACSAEPNDVTNIETQLVDDDSSDDACDGNPGIATLASMDVARSAQVDRFPATSLRLRMTVHASALWPYGEVEGFACVPIRSSGYGNGPHFERVLLGFSTEVNRDGRVVSVFSAERPVLDRHFIAPPPYAPGAYFGLRSEAGIVWAQGPGHDVSFSTGGAQDWVVQ